eukprot:2376669-Alexandrium_andersonii.AAC.1
MPCSTRASQHSRASTVRCRMSLCRVQNALMQHLHVPLESAYQFAGCRYWCTAAECCSKRAR